MAFLTKIKRLNSSEQSRFWFKNSFFGTIALRARYFCASFSFSLFVFYHAGFYYFAAAIANELCFSDAVVRLENFNGQIYFPSLLLCP